MVLYDSVFDFVDPFRPVGNLGAAAGDAGFERIFKHDGR